MDALPTSPAVPRIFRIAALRQEVEVEVMCTLLEVVDPKYDPTYNLPARSDKGSIKGLGFRVSEN